VWDGCSNDGPGRSPEEGYEVYVCLDSNRKAVAAAAAATRHDELRVSTWDNEVPATVPPPGGGGRTNGEGVGYTSPVALRCDGRKEEGRSESLMGSGGSSGRETGEGCDSGELGRRVMRVLH
jgi:hypothetical protein